MIVTTPGQTVWPQPAAGTLDGPWDQAFYYVVRGRVVSKSNYRHDVRNRTKWVALKQFAQAVELGARAARPRGWVIGQPDWPLEARPKLTACIFARTHLDPGNLDKSILDAVEGTPARGGKPATAGTVMVSDAQTATAAWSVRTVVDPGVLVAFARLPADSSAGDVARATAALVLKCTVLLERAGAFTP